MSDPPPPLTLTVPSFSRHVTARGEAIYTLSISTTIEGMTLKFYMVIEEIMLSRQKKIVPYMTPTSGGGPQCLEIRLFLLELFSVLNKSDLMLNTTEYKFSFTQIEI